MRSLLFLLTFVHWMFADGHVLIYHRFDDSRYPSTNISSQNLREQFQFFKDKGYEIVPLDKLVEYVKDKKPVPDNWIALTIDDGYKSFYKNGFEIFKEFGYPFTLFIYVEASAKKYGDFLTFEDIKEIQKYPGASVAYHSYSHHNMTSLGDEELKYDFEQGINVFENELGFKPKYFSYPYGEYDADVKRLTKEYKFDGAFNQNSGAINEDADLLNLDRITSMNGTNLKAMLSSKFLKADFILPLAYPKNNILDKVVAKIDENTTEAYLYVTGLGTRKVKVNNGMIDEKIFEKINKRRVRIIITDKHKTATQLIVKE